MDTFRSALLYHLKICARTYAEMASLTGVASRQMFKYKIDHDSFTRKELQKLKVALGLSDLEFLELLALKE